MGMVTKQAKNEETLGENGCRRFRPHSHTPFPRTAPPLPAHVPGLFLVEEEYRLALLAAETAFVEDFIGKITDPDTGWDPLWARFHGQNGPPAKAGS